MRTLKLSLILAALLIGITSFTGKVSAYVNVVIMEIPMKSIIQITAPKTVEASVLIYDEDGIVLYRDRFDENSSSTKVFDFTDLKDGVYTFKSYSNLMNITKKIKVDDSKIEIQSREEEYKPLFEVDGDKLKVNFFNHTNDEIHFSLENNDRIYFKAKGYTSDNFKKKIDISNLWSGEYYALLKVGNRTYYHPFSKN